MVKNILAELGYECKFFISSRPKTDTCYGLPLYLPEILNAENHYVFSTTRAEEVHRALMSKNFNEINHRDCTFIWAFWHDDIEFNGCFVGRGTYGYTTLGGDCLRLFVKKIGRYCSINASAKIEGNHRMDFITTSPLITNKRGAPVSEKIYAAIDKMEREQGALTEIGNDVWIGANVFLIRGVKIGDGAIIGAGAVVTHDVEPYAIMGGVPARVIRYRYPKEMIESFLRIKWWDWSLKKIEDNIELFYQPELFCKTFDQLEKDEGQC